jgi:hypothetical protein
MRKLLSSVSVLIFCFALQSCIKGNGRIIGVKIYDYKGDYDLLASEWREMGINTCFTTPDLAGNNAFRKAVKKNKIKIYIIFPVFQNPEILRTDTTLYAITDKGLKAKSDWVEFVCPSRQEYRMLKVNELSGLIRSLDPDGISLDFIRYFVYWEMIYPECGSETIARTCFCDNCLKKFSEEKNITIPDSCSIVTQKADFIVQNYSESWDIFRCNLITTMVQDLAQEARTVKHNIKINVHAVPWRETDFGGAGKRIAGQDLKNIAYFADFISPMCYSQMLKRDPEWISDVVTEMDNRCQGKILPSIQVYPEYIDRKFTTEDFRDCLNEALKPPSLGVVFFSWPLFEKDSSRIEAVKEVI